MAVKLSVATIQQFKADAKLLGELVERNAPAPGTPERVVYSREVIPAALRVNALADQLMGIEVRVTS